MTFSAQQLVVKISVSDMLRAQAFYEKILGFTTDHKYTINKGGNYGSESYMQLNAPSSAEGAFTLGLYKDINQPYKAMPQNGTVPSFIVKDIHATLRHFLEQKVAVQPVGKAHEQPEYIIENKSDDGYIDLFFFFCDSDNNALVIRQNLKK